MYFKCFYFSIVFLSFSSFFSWGKAHILPANTIFDLLILLSVLLTKPVFKDRAVAVISYLLLSYLFMSGLYSLVFKGDHLLDFLLNYKAFFYLVILTLFFGKRIWTPKNFEMLFKTLLLFFTLKYFISVVLGFGENRPILFRENNFELIFLALMFYLKFIIKGNVKPWEWLFTIIVFVLSGSKSAIPVFIFVATTILLRKISFKKIMIAAPLLLLLSGAFISLILTKYGDTGISGVDRLAFLRVFIDEMTHSSWLNIIFGQDRISPLMQSSCKSLYFYQGLFSYNNDGTCYSPILHSYFLRGIFDHGLLGLFTIYWISHLLLIKSGYTVKNSLVFNSVLFLNGLSVSGHNSTFFALSMIMFMGVRRVNTAKLTIRSKQQIAVINNFD